MINEEEKTKKIEIRHRIQLTDNSTDELSRQLKRTAKHSRRVVLVVPSHQMIDAVYDLLESSPFGKRNDVHILKYITPFYLYQKHFNTRVEYKEIGAPWEFSASLCVDEIQRIKNDPKWIDELERELSTSVFLAKGNRPIQVQIMLSKALCSPHIVAELESVKAKVIFFNPGSNDFQDYYHTFEKVDDKWVPTVEQRPHEQHYPTILRRLSVHYIVESDLAADQIKTSYSRNDYVIELERCGSQSSLGHDVVLLSSEVSYKRLSGYFPIIFEYLNKSCWKGKGQCVGNSIASPHSFNRLAYSIETMSGPVLVKLGEPHPNLIRNLNEQLGGGTQNIKKRILLDHARTVLRRMEPGSTIYFVGGPKTVGWLKEIPELSDINVVNADKPPSDEAGLSKDKNFVATVIGDKVQLASNFTKSKFAFDRYVNNNGIEGMQLQKLIVNLLVAVTSSIKRGTFEIIAQPDFRFGPCLAQGIEISNKKSPYSRLLKLCDAVISNHAEDPDDQREIYERYEAEIKGLTYRDKKSAERAEKKKKEVEESLAQ